MKKTLALLLTIVTLSASAQYYYHPQPQVRPEAEAPTLPDNRWFLGSGLTLAASFGSYGSFALGANPEIGYSVSQLLDMGMSFNVNYYGYSNIDGFNTKQNNFNYGVGAFARLHLFPGFFIQALPEYNWITSKVIYNNGTTYSQNQSAASFLVGCGFGRRIVGQSSFYTAIMLDVGSEYQSPYKNYDGSLFPVFRTGFNFYLGAKKK